LDGDELATHATLLETVDVAMEEDESAVRNY
jgi:hypothetical protein